MQRLGDHFGAMAGEMKNVMDRCRLMLEDPALFQRREMEQDMERLHNHLGDMSAEMENSVQIMERMTQRLQLQKRLQLQTGAASGGGGN